MGGGGVTRGYQISPLSFLQSATHLKRKFRQTTKRAHIVQSRSTMGCSLLSSLCSFADGNSVPAKYSEILFRSSGWRLLLPVFPYLFRFCLSHWETIIIFANVQQCQNLGTHCFLPAVVLYVRIWPFFFSVGTVDMIRQCRYLFNSARISGSILQPLLTVDCLLHLLIVLSTSAHVYTMDSKLKVCIYRYILDLDAYVVVETTQASLSAFLSASMRS